MDVLRPAGEIDPAVVVAHAPGAFAECDKTGVAAKATGRRIEGTERVKSAQDQAVFYPVNHAIGVVGDKKLVVQRVVADIAKGRAVVRNPRAAGHEGTRRHVIGHRPGDAVYLVHRPRAARSGERVVVVRRGGRAGVNRGSRHEDVVVAVNGNAKDLPEVLRRPGWVAVLGGAGRRPPGARCAGGVVTHVHERHHRCVLVHACQVVGG